MINPPHRYRRTRPDLHRREGRLRLGAILLSVALLLLTAYLVWSHLGGP